MTILLSIKLAWRSIIGNKLRSALTMLGVIIGVASVITLVSVGEGARIEIQQHLQSLGSNVIEVYSHSWEVKFTPELLENLKERVQGIKYIMPVMHVGGNLKWRNTTFDCSGEGVGEDFLPLRDLELVGGRGFTKADISNRGRVMVVGSIVADKLFRGTNPVGQEVYLQGQQFTVIGVLKAKISADQEWGIDRTVYIPYSTAMRIHGYDRIDTINIKAKGALESAQAAAQLKRIFYKIHRRDDAVYIMSRDDMMKQIAEMNLIMTLMLGAIAGISLVVGGIGIMNIMLVSVSERTREIGIRKAVGAKNSQVLGQFLIEAVILSSAGGIVGIFLGTGDRCSFDTLAPPRQ